MLINHEISNETIMDLLSLALEGGSNYWYSDVDTGEPPVHDFPPSYMEYDWWQTWPLMGGSIRITERYTEDGTLTVHVLNGELIKKGLKLMSQKSPWHFSNIVGDNMDIETGDVFLQYCLLGEIVYG